MVVCYVIFLFSLAHVCLVGGGMPYVMLRQSCVCRSEMLSQHVCSERHVYVVTQRHDRVFLSERLLSLT